MGDIIKYKSYAHEGNASGIMIVGSFDFFSDFAARSYFAIETIKWDDKDKNPSTLFISGAAPGILLFSFATEDEIKEFYNTIKEKDPKGWKIYFKDGPEKTIQNLKENIEKYNTSRDSVV